MSLHSGSRQREPVDAPRPHSIQLAPLELKQARNRSVGWVDAIGNSHSGSPAGRHLPQVALHCRSPHSEVDDHVPHEPKPGHVTAPWHAAADADAMAAAMTSGSPVAAAVRSAASSSVVPVEILATGAG